MQCLPASPSDHVRLSHLTKISKAYWGYSPEQMAVWDEELTILPAYIEQHQVWKLVEEEKVIAYYSFWMEDPQTAYLDNLFLDPVWIGQGLGRIFLQDAMARMAGGGATSVRLDADPHAEAFYRHQGFQVTGQLQSGIPGRFLPIMEKDLTDYFPPPVFMTQRLQIRDLQSFDLLPFHEMQSDPAVMRYIKPPVSWSESKSELIRFMEKSESPFSHFFAVCEKQHQELIGMIGAYENGNGETELAWRLRPNWWRKGLGAEMADALITYVFQTFTEINQLTAYAHPENHGSIRILAGHMEWVEDVFLEKYQMTSRKFQIDRHRWVAGGV